MYVTEDFVYLQLQKTAGTHIAQLLSVHCPDGQQIGKHNPLTPQLLASGRKIIGSVRDPWDWYVSLWAFGCDGKGALHERLTNRVDRHRVYSAAVWLRAAARRLSIPVADWRAVYADRNDAALFQRWLKMMFDPRRADDIGEGYGKSSLRQFAGFLTFRYLRLFARESSKLFDGSLTDHSSVAQYAETHNLMRVVIRFERLEDDLLDALTALARPASEEQARRMRSAPRTNASTRNRDYSTYYDAESVDLVAERERLIVSRFGYVKPRLRLTSSGS
jgi:hypothetical protein